MMKSLRNIWMAALLAAGAATAGSAELMLCSGGSLEGRGFIPGSEFPGAKGGIAADAGTGAVTLNYDFSGGGQYVGVSHSAACPAEAEELRFSLAADQAAQVMVRVVDAGGRTFQSEPRRLNAGQAAEMVLPLRAEWHQAWGGNHESRTPVLPVGNMLLMVEKNDSLPLAGKVGIRDISVAGRNLQAVTGLPENFDLQVGGWRIAGRWQAGAESAFLEVEAVPGNAAGDLSLALEMAQTARNLIHRANLKAGDGKAVRSWKFPMPNPRAIYQVAVSAACGPETFIGRMEFPGRLADRVSLGAPKNARDIRTVRFGSSCHYSYWKGWTHWAPYRELIDLMADCGFKIIRDGATFEFDQAEQRWRISGRDREWIAYGREKGLETILLIWMEAKTSPEEFARQCADIARDTEGLVNVFELGNEPMGMGGWRETFGGTWNAREPDNSDSPWMLAHLKSTNLAADAIRAVRPGAVILGTGSTAPTNIRQLRAGLSPNVNGLVEHPYSFAMPPEKVPWNTGLLERDGILIGDDQGTVRGLIQSYSDYIARYGGNRSVWITEFGFTNFWFNGKNEDAMYIALTEEAQAVYLLRRQLAWMDMPVIAAVIQYDFLDDWSSDPGDPEANFGLIRGDHSPKPSFFAMQRFNSLWADTVKDDRAAVNLIRQPAHRGTLRGKIVEWDSVDINADNGVMFQAGKPLDGDGERSLAVWSLQPYSREFNNRVVSFEITGWSEFDARPAAVDMITGLVMDVPARLENGVWIFENLSLKEHPLTIKFYRSDDR